MTKILTVMNLKGGSGKTTTTAHLAHAYAAQGLSVVIVDADPQNSIMRWSERAGWDLPVFSKPVPKLHQLLGGIIGDRFDVVLIDTPGMDDKPKSDEPDRRRGIVHGALRAADFVLVPLAPAMIEMERLPDVWDVLQEVDDIRDDGLDYAVLFNRVVHNAVSTGLMSANLVKRGHRVLETKIPRREALSQSFGRQITDLYGHDLVAAEIEKKVSK